MDLIKFSSTLKRKKMVAECVKALKDKLSEIPDLHTFRQSDELTEIICCVVEHLLSKKAKKYKIDKKAVVLDVYAELFASAPLSADEREIISKRIEFLHEKGLIKAVPIIKWVSKGFLNWLKKKIL